MKPEIITIDHDETTSPHAQEVEFALILNRMINMAKQDPTQLRFAVYEFARNKLENIPWADDAERQRQLASLEIAIKGVEQFSQRVDQNLALQGPAASLTLGSPMPAPLATNWRSCRWGKVPIASGLETAAVARWRNQAKQRDEAGTFCYRRRLRARRARGRGVSAARVATTHDRNEVAPHHRQSAHLRFSAHSVGLRVSASYRLRDLCA